jgi:beta-glucosidase/6-phospho-beta-glucosidase/beta-galactosidase
MSILIIICDNGSIYWDYFTRNERIRNRITFVTKQNRFYKGAKEVTLEPAECAVRMWKPEFYLTDFDNASALGLNAFRISIEWTRIQPEKKALEFRLQ